MVFRRVPASGILAVLVCSCCNKICGLQSYIERIYVGLGLADRMHCGDVVLLHFGVGSNKLGQLG